MIGALHLNLAQNGYAQAQVEAVLHRADRGGHQAAIFH